MRALWLVLLVACGSHPPDAGDDDTDPDARLPTDDGAVDGGIEACVPRTCASFVASCGEIADDGCGQPLDCGGCSAPATCGGQGMERVCAVPSAERTCRDGWCWEAPAPMPYAPNAVFARTEEDVWAVGSRGVVLHFDGTGWTQIAASTSADLHGIWMASATDGWLVGAGGVVRRWNGTTWATVASGTTKDLRGVHGLSASSVWFVGDGVSRHWNGSSLISAALSTPSLDRVFAASASAVFGIGEGRVWKLATATWSAQTDSAPILSAYDLFGIAGTATSVYAAGRSHSIGSSADLVYHWDGDSWTRLPASGNSWILDVYRDGTAIYAMSPTRIVELGGTTKLTAPPGADFRHAAGAGGKVFAAGSAGEPWRHDGTTWQLDTFGSYQPLHAIAEVGGALWFGGLGRVVEWRNGLVEHSFPAPAVVAIAGTSRDDLWAADFDDPFWADNIYHFDGTAWQRVAPPGLTEVHAISVATGHPLLIGDGVFRRDGNTWSEESASPAPVMWRAADELDSALYIVGSERTEDNTSVAHIARKIGDVWSELAAPTTEVLCGITVVAPDDIWVSGYDGAIYPSTPQGTVSHWNGTSWTTTSLAAAGELCTIAVHQGEVWTSGSGTSLYRRSSSGVWTDEPPLAVGSIRALHASSGGELWAVGDGGAILHR
ncbi:MAG: hypothetical protein AB7P03_02465 [Kofleriaceae bacterium]